MEGLLGCLFVPTGIIGTGIGIKETYIYIIINFWGGLMMII